LGKQLLDYILECLLLLFSGQVKDYFLDIMLEGEEQLPSLKISLKWQQGIGI
jgi:hypothetical protein